MPNIPDVTVGTIVASVIAGLISLLGLIISKEQKISEFRQTWIDALRQEIASLISHANCIHGHAVVGYGSLQEHWTKAHTDFLDINRAAAAIRLRLNPREVASLKILSTIEEMEQLLVPGQIPPHNRLNEIEKRLVAEAAVVLKNEWNTVRKGEIVYRPARLTALLVALGAIAFGAYVAYRVTVISHL